ncbi:TlpA family protein disulfide reductase [Roseovarius salinarum]|uniref:TlpA family protein disulfide reductase n=1 Tax=Roseovarius salinarum TaxID=1981892 RepID=UPI000C33BC38|nr:TlpA disulfide reductase family protein [Roseovarius salinarum]
MRLNRSTVLYLAIGVCAIAALAFFLQRSDEGASRTADAARIEALREGDMKKLNVHATPRAVSESAFETIDGEAGTLADFAGKHLLVNFWATWCAPCRKEMPMLSELQTDFGGPDFEVVTIATGRNPPPAMKKFFDEIGVDNLPLHRDPDQKIARDMGILGLPITIIVDPQGREVARLQGDADWNSDSARAIVRALVEAG